MSTAVASSRPVAIVTGATGTFGEHISLGLLRAGYNTICVGRSAEKGAELIARLKGQLAKESKSTSFGEASFAAIDCSSLAAIETFAAQWAEKQSAAPAIHVLVNNAAIVPANREVSAAGVELQWAANVLGYDWMIRSLAPFLKAASATSGTPARIVNVASHYAGNLDFRDLEFSKPGRPYDSNAAYRQSKQANRMQAKLWADRLERDNIVVTSCHPGVANSAVLQGLGFRGSASGQSGSVTPLFCALTTHLASGGFYADKALQNCPFASNAADVKKLGDVLDAYTTAAGGKRLRDQ